MQMERTENWRSNAYLRQNRLQKNAATRDNEGHFIHNSQGTEATELPISRRLGKERVGHICTAEYSLAIKTMKPYHLQQHGLCCRG